jgi:HEAT repeat protein
MAAPIKRDAFQGSESIPGHLLNSVRKKSCVLFVGPRLAAGLKEHGGGQTLMADELAYRLALELQNAGYLTRKPAAGENAATDIPRLAESYETVFGRQRLLLLVQEVFAAPTLEPAEVHFLAIRLFPLIVTTNYDVLLERAAVLEGRNVAGIPLTEVGLGTHANGPSIFKLHGDITLPDRIAITSSDRRQMSSLNAFRAEFGSVLPTWTSLFVGFDLPDDELQEIYYELPRPSRRGNRVFVVAPSPPEGSQNLKLWEMFRQRWESKNVRVLTSSAVELLSRIDRELAGKTAMPPSPGPKGADAGNLKDADALLSEYIALVKERTEKASVPGEERSERLADVFVAPELFKLGGPTTTGRQQEDMRRAKETLSSVPDGKDRQDQDLTIKQGLTVKLEELTREGSRALVLGAPGSGKTTLVKQLIQQAFSGHERLPVLVELRGLTPEIFDRHRGRFRPLLFNSTIGRVLRVGAGERKRLRSRFYEMLDAGKVDIFLDGLDEIPQASLRTQVSRSVGQFGSAINRCNVIVVTTRSAATFNSLPGFDQIEIRPFSKENVREFLNRRLSDRPAAERLSSEISKSPQLLALARFPLLLDALAKVQNGKSPGGGLVLELYERMLQQLVTRLDEEKHPSRFRVEDSGGLLKLDLLKALAYDRLLVQKTAGESGRIIFTDREILAKAERLQRPGVNPHLLAADVTSTPLLQEVAPHSFSFIHRSFEEYLAARALAERDDCETVFCRTYFDQNLAESDVLPMALGLALNPSNLYLALEQLPDSLTHINLRLRARGLRYVTHLEEERLSATSEQLNQLILGGDAEGRQELESRYMDDVLASFSAMGAAASDYIIGHLAPLLGTAHNWFVRRRVAESLGKIGGEPALKVLLNALIDLRSDITGDISRALGKIGDERAVEPLTKALKEWKHWSSAFALAEIGGEHAQNALMEALESPESSLRWAATMALAKFRAPKVVDRLVQALKDESELVRWSAADSLAETGDERAVDGLIAALATDDSSVRFHAAQALGEIGGERALGALRDAIRSNDQQTRWGAALGLAKQLDEQAIPPLLEMLRQHEDIFLWRPAARALSHIGGEHALNGLIELFGEQVGGISVPTAEVLAQIGDERTIETLVAALKSPDEWRRISAAVALGEIGDARGAGTLLEVLAEKGHRERWRAVVALAGVGDERAVPELLSLFDHSEEFVRERAAKALHTIPGRALVAGLLKSLSHEDVSVRRLAASVVGYYTDSDQVLEALLRLASADPIDGVRREADEARFKFYRKLGYLNQNTSALDRAEEIGRERAMEDTRAFVAHELKNAIVPLRIYAQLLIESMSGSDSSDGKPADYANRIIKQTDRAYDIVTEIIDYTKPLAPKLERTDMNELVSEIVNEIREKCAQSDIRVRYDPGQIGPVNIDRALVGQALRNVLLNAIEAMESGGTLAVATRQDGGKVVIAVSDTGIGVRPEHLGRVFDLGFTTKGERHGAGIGLPIVRRIVEEGHAGRVRIVNNPGDGATIFVDIPMARGEGLNGE